tara:strand:+ start:2336 stop:2785 length:450 start_codon:yes stop_codon:yes gene_type:complete
LQHIQNLDNAQEFVSKLQDQMGKIRHTRGTLAEVPPSAEVSHTIKRKSNEVHRAPESDWISEVEYALHNSRAKLKKCETTQSRLANEIDTLAEEEAAIRSRIQSFEVDCISVANEQNRLNKLIVNQEQQLAALKQWQEALDAVCTFADK